MGDSFNYMNNFLVQESIAIMFVALGLTILGIGYARIKTKESLQLHRWVMRGAVVLTLSAIFFVMFPSLFIYYTTISNNALSGFSFLQIVHSAGGVPAIILSVMYLFNDLPSTNQEMDENHSCPLDSKYCVRCSRLLHYALLENWRRKF